MNVDLRRLRYFVTVAEELHFGRAAARLEMSTPPLSQRIRELEAALGVVLFDRTSRSVALTTAGEALVPAAREVLAALERFGDVAAGLGATAHLATIAVGYSHGSEIGVLAALQRFRRDHPTVSIRTEALTSAVVHDRVVKRRLDVGVVRPAADLPRGLAARRLAAVDLDHVALPLGHRLLRCRGAINPGDLAGETLLVVDRADSPTVHDDLVGYFATRAIDVRWVSHPATQIERGLDMVALGTGLAWLNPWQAERMGSRTDVVIRRLAEPVRTESFVAVWREPADPSVTALVGDLAATFAPLL